MLISSMEAKLIYEMVCYRGLIAGVQQMGQNEIVQLLQQNLQQEEQTARLLEECLPQLLQETQAVMSR